MNALVSAIGNGKGGMAVAVSREEGETRAVSYYGREGIKHAAPMSRPIPLKLRRFSS